MRIFIVLLLFSSTLMAEPTTITKFLIKDTVSVLDFGLYKIEFELDNNPPAAGITQGYANTYYDLNANRIVIAYEGYFDLNYTISSDIKVMCKHIITGLRQFFDVDIMSGEIYTLGEIKLEKYFGHAGVQNNSMPKNLGKEIAKLIQLRVWTTARIDGGGKDIECEASLLGTEVRFRE